MKKNMHIYGTSTTKKYLDQLDAQDSLKRYSMLFCNHMCVCSQEQTYNLCLSNATQSKTHASKWNITKGILWEGVHIPSQWSNPHCCLWWEGTPERAITDHRDTMPWRVSAVQNIPIHQHSHYSYPACSPLSWLHEKSSLLTRRKTDDNESHA